jgi:predicted enzyme involved in methoxymalonyl-ACP biosynthesis
MFEHLCECARQQGIPTIRGLYIATARNQLVKDLFSQLGFERVEAADGTEVWDYDLAAASPIANRFIQKTTKGIDNGYSPALGARV